MIIFCIFLLPNDKAQAIPAETGTTLKLTTVIDKITDVVVAAILKTVSTDSHFGVCVL